MCIVLRMDYREYEDMPLEQLTVIREHALDRLQKVTEALKIVVRAEHLQGVPIKKLARKANVTRNTVYAWLSE